MQTGATGLDLTTLGIQVAELLTRGIRLGLHTYGDALPPLGSKPRRMATAMGVRSLTPGPANTRDELSHEPRADGKTLGELPDGAFLAMVSGQHIRTSI